MALQCGIIGITNTGKTTLFNCMSNTRAQSTDFAFSSTKSNIGIVNVPDDRLIRLGELVKPEKVVPTTVEIVDIPGLTKGSSKGEGIGNKFLVDIRNTDALIHVLRCFDKENLSHIDGSVNPVRDKETIDLELQIKDLESIEKKIQKVEKMAKSGDKVATKELEVLYFYKSHIESLQPARTAPVDEKNKKIIDDLFLLTAKPVMYVCNVDESSAVHGNNYVEAVKEAVIYENTEVLIIAADMEAEIEELENLEERMEFLKDAGLKQPGVNKLIRSAYKLLDLISFFTTCSKEARAWTMKKGLNVLNAAGIIHSDMERGFIKAEVIKYQDFIKFGSEQGCKEAGKLLIEGKNYIVKDGDILRIRFNV